ncbi:RraA family protein [Methylobacterium sp. J-077]|uniref:RraA family protein n=1 Tax=Methylobacterium sp. J-077 TaxID=2836656 RepID=UPI001FB9B4FB|nr:RraA family protein [Methylobacterium sp. J-077]MCJ2127181.1 RraA family protein [Methylobacterium sp. J-077]
MPATSAELNTVPAVAPEADVEALRTSATPPFSDNLDRLGDLIGLQRCEHTGKRVGAALTVKSRPGDNLGFSHALAVMKPGHVIVIDGGAGLNNALYGDMMRAYAVSRGCTGFMVDGAIRAIATFAAGDLPCYARGVGHRGPYKSGPAQINLPVSVGNQVVNTGDVVSGDDDGLIAFSPDQPKALIDDARQAAPRARHHG